MTDSDRPRLAPSAISPWRRPGFIGFAFLLRSVFALIAALGLSGTVRASGIGEFSGGDRLLFEDGALYLLELLRLAGPELLAAAGASAAVLCLGLLSGLLVAAVLLTALNTDGRLGVGSALGRAAALFPTFFLLGALVLLAQSALLLGASMTFALVNAASSSERSADLLAAAVALVAGLCALALGSLLDVARAAAVRHELASKHALLFALDVARRAPAGALLGSFPYTAAGALIVLGAALATGAIDVGAPGAGRLLAVAALHQLTLLALLVLRAAWLSRALRLVATHAPTRRLELTSPALLPTRSGRG